MDIESNKSFCICCLQNDKPLLNTEKCRYIAYLKTILMSIKPILPTLLVCNQCHEFLKKIESFKMQVMANFNFLSNLTVQRAFGDRMTCKVLLLEKSKTITNSYPDFDESIEIKNINDEELSQNSTYEDNGLDIKIEKCYSSDLEFDIPLSKIKNGDCHGNGRIKNKKKLKKKLKRRKVISDPNVTKKGSVRLRKQKLLDPNKIKMIVMSKEELLLEREKESKSEAYLKFPYKCKKCIIGFDYVQTLNDHEARRHDLKIGQYICDVCESVFKSQASYNTHRRRHLLRFACVACGKRTIDKDAMLKHYGTAHDLLTTSYTCEECGLLSLSYRAYRYHREKHREKPQCADCGKTFINKNSLRLHILNIHQCERTFSCTVCGKVYKGKSGLSQHMWAHDNSSGEAAYCAPCGVQFKSAYNYRNHLKTHSKHLTDHDLIYACDSCGARFASARRRREHVDREHADTHACPVCHKTFRSRVGLQRHRRFVHEKRRPPRNKMCHHCGRGFTTVAILRAHIRTHTGERPLACASCAATFAHSAALYTHNKLVHGRKRRIDTAEIARPEPSS